MLNGLFERGDTSSKCSKGCRRGVLLATFCDDAIMRRDGEGRRVVNGDGSNCMLM